MERDSRTKILEAIVLFVLLALAVLYAVKSWRVYFFTGLAEHWDPKLMGEWMAWNAHNILHGHFLVPDYHANFFYPHSYTLAFSELLWPESFLYALFYALTANPFFSFNATMLFFWVISGVLLFVLLRTFDVSLPISALGGLIYCLMPFRMPYYVEFNMVLVFIFPLLLLLLTRWLREPSIANALFFCIGYLISATSCLYYTIMAIIIMVFVTLAFLAADKSLLHSRRFYLTGAVIGLGVLVISLVYLYPYALLRLQGYQRSTADYLKYFAQPMQYLDTGCAALLKWIKMPRSRFTETHLFPGTVLSLLAIVFVVNQGIRLFRTSPFARPSGYLAVLRLFLWVVFWSLILLHTFKGPVGWLQPLDPYVHHLAIILIFFSIVGLFLPETRQKPLQTLLAGLATAAVLCFFVSFGPFISIGPDNNRLIIASGPFLDLASWNPLFSAVRSLTRFSIVILTFLTVAGCYVLNLLAQKNKKIIWALPVLAMVLLYEARQMEKYRFEDCTATINSEVIKKAQDLPGNHVLFQLPVAIRNAEANIVMATIGKFPLLIDGWSGFEPEYFRQLFSWEEGQWGLEKILPWVIQVWPEVYLVIDQDWVEYLEKGWEKPFPWPEVEKGWEMIGKDERFSLYRQRQNVLDSDQIVRLVRTDMLKSHPRLTFMAHKTDPEPVSVSIRLNHQNVGSPIALADSWQKFTIPLPIKAMGNIKGEEVDLDVASHSPSPRHWEVKEIGFEAMN